LFGGEEIDRKARGGGKGHGVAETEFGVFGEIGTHNN
jgi:hypothetical protein